MLPREVLRQIRRLQLKARRAVEDLLGGEYHSVFKGAGMAFEEVREYQPGDDVRSIDWNVTARMGHPFVKRFVEERELTVLLAVDVSGSNQFGSGLQQKREVAAELAAVLAFSAISNNDRVGLIQFTDRVEHFVPPGKGTRHVLRLIRDVLFFQPQRTGTSLARGSTSSTAFSAAAPSCSSLVISSNRKTGLSKKGTVPLRKRDSPLFRIAVPFFGSTTISRRRSSVLGGATISSPCA